MSAWTVYWILQLDDINTFIAIASAFIFVLATVAAMPGYIDGDEICKRICKRLAILLAFLLSIGMFLPSSKTAAAMVILPAIANNEKMHAEVQELYGLTKQALKKAVKNGVEEKNP